MNLQEIKAAAEAATPGPWEAAGPSFGGPLPRYLNCVGVVTEDDEFEDVCSAPDPQDGTSTADMTHIATANPSAVLEMVARIEQLETALAECRDAMPSPAPGERPEQSWSEAIGDPLAVPAYIKETMARVERENAELKLELKFRSRA